MRETINSKNGSEPLLTYQEARDLDDRTMAWGWNSTALMGQAALTSLYRLEQRICASSRIAIFCGPGNNGGDGLALAWHIRSACYNQPLELTVIQTAAARSDASKFYEGLLRRALQQQSGTDGGFSLALIDAESFLASQLERPDLIVDALLGSGQNRPPEGVFAKLLERMAAWQSEGSYALSMDVPSGLLEDRAFGETAILIPDEIHTYGPHRLACFLSPHLAAARIHSNPMGFVPLMPTGADSTERSSRFNSASADSTRTDARANAGLSISPAANANSESDDSHRPCHYSLMHRNPHRLQGMRKSAHEHKYVSGAAWILGGSRGMEGALLLSAGSFFASGGGILWGLGEDRAKLLHSDPAILWSESFHPEKSPGAVVIGPGASPDDARRYLQMVTEPLQKIWKDAEGSQASARAPEQTSPNSAANLQQWQVRTDQVGGQSEDTAQHRTRARTHLVLDAAATSHIADFESLQGPHTILTPHVGEWKKLGGNTIEDVASLEKAMELAARLQCHVLYKSSISIHLDPFRGRARVYPWINPSLSVAGSGDCLAGILAASLCRTTDVTAAIATAMELLHAASGSLIHPESSQFPDAIRGVLHEVSL